MTDLARFTALLRKEAAPGRKAKDRELWDRWKRSGSPQDLQAVLDQLKPVIAREVNRWAGGLARPTLETKAKALAVKAIKSYNPSHGTALSTHVTNDHRTVMDTDPNIDMVIIMFLEIDLDIPHCSKHL